MVSLSSMEVVLPQEMNCNERCCPEMTYYTSAEIQVTSDNRRNRRRPDNVFSMVEFKHQQKSDIAVADITSTANPTNDLYEQQWRCDSQRKFRELSCVGTALNVSSVVEEQINFKPDKVNGRIRLNGGGHDDKAFQRLCEYCGVIFKSRSSYYRHVGSCYSKLAPNLLANRYPTCNKCSKTFTSQYYFVSHTCKMRKSVRAKGEVSTCYDKLELTCAKCFKYFDTRSSLSQHVSTCKGIHFVSYPKKCKVCLKVCDDKKSFNEHKNVCHVILEEASIGTESTLENSNKSGKGNTITKGELSSKLDKKREFTCSKCSLRLRSSLFLDRHMMVCKGSNVKLYPRTCQNCSKVCVNANSFYYHKMKCSTGRLNKLTCAKCSVTLSTSFSFNRHIYICKGPKVKLYPRTCQVCSKVCDSATSFYRHKKRCPVGQIMPYINLSTAIPSNYDSNNHRSTNSEEELTCAKCLKKCFNQPDLTQHMSICKGYKSVQNSKTCKVCFKVFSSQISFYRHRKSCRIRPKFSLLNTKATSSNLNDTSNSEFSHSTGVQTLPTCSKCCKSFAYKSSLVRHMPRCTGPKVLRNPILCKICMNVYSSKSLYYKHRKLCFEKLKLTTAPQLNNISVKKSNRGVSRNKPIQKPVTHVNIQLSKKVVKKYRKIIANKTRNKDTARLSIQSNNVSNQHTLGMRISDSSVSTKTESKVWKIVLQKPFPNRFTVVLKSDTCKIPDHCYHSCLNFSCMSLCAHMYTCSCFDSTGLCSHIHKIHSLNNKNRLFEYPRNSNSSVSQSGLVDNTDKNSELIKSIGQMLHKISLLLPDKNVAHLLPHLYEELNHYLIKLTIACKVTRKTPTIIKVNKNSNNVIPDNNNSSFQFVRVLAKIEDLTKTKTFVREPIVQTTQMSAALVLGLPDIVTQAEASIHKSFTYPLLNAMQLQNVVTTVNKIPIKLLDLKSLDFNIPESECALIIRTVKTFRRGWLYDSVIDAYLYIVSQPHPNIIAVPTFVCAFLSNKNIDFDTLLTHFTDYDFTGKRMILFPCIVGGNHWILVIVNMFEKYLTVCDPLTQDFVESSQYITCRVKGILSRKVNSVISPVMWRVLTPIAVRQKDAFNCGVFICYYAFQYINHQSLREKFNPFLYRKVIYETIINYQFIMNYTESFGKTLV